MWSKMLTWEQFSIDTFGFDCCCNDYACISKGQCRCLHKDSIEFVVHLLSFFQFAIFTQKESCGDLPACCSHHVLADHCVERVKSQQRRQFFFLQLERRVEDDTAGHVMVIIMRQPLVVLVWRLLCQKGITIFQRGMTVVSLKLFDELTKNAEVACVGNSSNNHPQLLLEKQPTKTRNGLCFAASRRPLDKSQRISSTFLNSFILLLIEILLMREVDDYVTLDFFSFLLQVINDVCTLIELLALVLILVEGVDVLVCTKGGIGLGEEEARPVLHAASSEEDIRPNHYFALAVLSREVEICWLDLEDSGTIWVAQLQRVFVLRDHV